MVAERSSQGELALLVEQAGVLEMIVRGRPLADVLAALCQIVERGAEQRVRAAILLVDAGGRHLRTAAAPNLPEAYCRAIDGLAIAPDVGTCAAAAARRDVVISPDIARDPGWARLSHLALELGLRAAWSMPILSSSDAVLGTFGTYFFEARDPLPHERRLVEVLARTAALAIERDRADRSLRTYAARERFLSDLDAAAQMHTEAADVMLTAARMLAEHLEVDRCAYAAVDDERVFDITGDHTRGVPSIVGRWEVAAFGPACVAHMLAGTPYVVEDSEADARVSAEHLPAYRATNIRAVVCVPLHKHGVFTAAMAVHQRVPRRWSADEIDLVGTVVARCWEALERARVSRHLRDSKGRLDYAARVAGVGFWYCDLPFDELVWDAQVRAHFWLPADVRVTLDTFYDRIHPDDRAASRAAIEAAIRDRAGYDVVYRTVDAATGAIKWIRALGSTQYAASGAPIYFDGVTVDVTAQKLAENELREHDRRKDAFLATLAHELRNPLAPIRNGLQLLKIPVAPEQAARTHEVMERQLGHLVRMVDDLLDISRVTLGKITLARARVDLRDVLDSAIETTRPLIEAAGHALAVRLPAGPLPLDGDPTRLSQVFANLLNNAAKYTPAGGRIVITAEGEASRVRVRVADTGVGIAGDMLPYVFDMFTQVDRTIERSQGGLGVGLTLVRRLVELHGGSVIATSPGIGEGSAFVVTLPLAVAAAAARSPEAPEVAAAPTAGLRIAIVDDNVDAAETLAMLLAYNGNLTEVAHSGATAPALVARFRPDVVFLDIGLPGIDGYEVARRVRADAGLVQPVLVALTGWGADADRRQARAAGFDHHLVKPVELAQIEAVLARVRCGPRDQ